MKTKLRLMDLDSTVKRELLKAIIEDRVSKEELLDDLVVDVLTIQKPIILFINEWGGQTTYLYNGKKIEEEEFKKALDICNRFINQNDFILVKAPSVIPCNIPLAKSEDDIFI